MDGICRFLLLVLAFETFSAYAESMNENRLLDSLLMDYNKRVIDKPADVMIGMTLLRVLDLDIDKNIVHLDAWMVYRWNDSRLRWDPSDFGDTKKVVIPTTDIWTPDITVYNSAEESKPIASHVAAIVEEDGDIAYIQPIKLGFYCNIKSSLREHFRMVSCPLKLGSWVYDGYEMNLRVEDDTVDLSSYDPEFNKGVTLVSAPAEVQTTWYACCNEPYHTAFFNFSFSL